MSVLMYPPHQRGGRCTTGSAFSSPARLLSRLVLQILPADNLFKADVLMRVCNPIPWRCFPYERCHNLAV